MAWTTRDLVDYYKRQGKAPPEAFAAACDAPAKKTKYNNRKTLCDGIEFDSWAEALFYQGLLLELRYGKISDLVRQPRFLLQAGFRGEDGKWNRKIEYVADFQFTREGREDPIVVDVKSRATMTAAARLKHKLFRQKFSDLRLELWARSGKDWIEL